MKKLILLVLITILSAILITACSPDSDIESGDNAQNANEALTESEFRIDGDAWTDEVDIIGLPVGEYTYILSTIPIEHGISAFSAITVTDGIIYGAAVMSGAGTTDNMISFFSLDLETEDITFYPPSTNLVGEGNIIEIVAANDGGEIFFVNQKYVYDNETLTLEESLLLSKIDTFGNVGFVVDITEHLNFSENEDWITPPYAIVLDDDGNIYVQAQDGSVLMFDSGGNYQITIEHPEGTWTQAAGIPFWGTDGTMLFPIRDFDEGNRLFSIDNEMQRLIPHQPLPDADAFSSSLHGDELFLITDTGVYSYSLESGEQNRVFHWLEVDIRSSSVFHAGEGRFVFLDFTRSHWPDAIAVLTQSAVEDDVRTIITMASLFPNYRFVYEFNIQSTEYRIAVLDYSDDDISAAITRFNIDMIAGRIPDIIDLTGLNYHDLANGGFLADLNVWFENDSDISRTDFHERVFDVLELNDNLYAVAPAFIIATYLAPSSLVGTTPGMTLERLMQLEMQVNDGNSLLQNEISQSFIEMHTLFNRSSLIDFEMGTVHFETDEFLQVLEYANRLSRNEVVPPFDEYIPFEIDIRRGNNHINYSMIYTLDQLYQIETEAGTQITPIGFPLDDGVGSLMLPESLYSIGAGAQNSSGAWAFLRFLLTTNQPGMFHGIHVSRASFDEWAEQSMNPPPIEDNSNLTNEIYVDGDLVVFTPMTQDQANRTLEMIETLGGLLTDGNEIIMNIVAEEADAFLTGHRSAEDTARIIQSRALIYVSERHR